MRIFETPHALASWLQAQGINTASWGQGAAKSVADLWQEVQHAESTFYDEAPLHRVRVVELLVLDDSNRQLIEAAQTLVTGQVRHRNRPPSEKMHPTEDPFTAARRCLIEELGVEVSAIRIEPTQSIGERQEYIESASYPGLATEFTFYRVTAQVHHLPTTAFTTRNAAHAHGDPVVAHEWHWQAYPPARVIAQSAI